jgi:hypothetical protein
MAEDPFAPLLSRTRVQGMGGCVVGPASGGTEDAPPCGDLGNEESQGFLTREPCTLQRFTLRSKLLGVLKEVEVERDRADIRGRPCRRNASEITGCFFHLVDHSNLDGVLRDVPCRSVNEALNRLGNRFAFV